MEDVILGQKCTPNHFNNDINIQKEVRNLELENYHCLDKDIKLSMKKDGYEESGISIYIDFCETKKNPDCIDLSI